MAANESSLGLKKIELADVLPTGIPTAWTELEDTPIESATLSETEPTTENIFIEQSKNVYRTITTEDGVMTLVIDTYDVSPANIARLKGGTVTTATSSEGSKWQASNEVVEINKAIKITTLDDYILIIPNGKVVANINWQLTKTALARVTITITAQAPLDPTLGALIVEAPDKTA